MATLPIEASGFTGTYNTWGDSGAAPSWFTTWANQQQAPQPQATQPPPVMAPGYPSPAPPAYYPVADTLSGGGATNIPYGTYPWAGMPQYVTDAIQGLFTGQGGTGVAGGVWDWLEKARGDLYSATTSQQPVNTTNLLNVAGQLTDPGRARMWGQEARAGLDAGMYGLREDVFRPILNQLSDKTGFTGSTTAAQALGGGMGQVGKAYLEQLQNISKTQQDMTTQGLTEGLKGYGLDTEYQKEYLNRLLSSMQQFGAFNTETLKALDTFLYAIRQQEDPLAPYKALLDFMKQ